MEGYLPCSKSTDLDVNLIQKHLRKKTSRITFHQICGHHGPAKSTHKIKHHTGVGHIWPAMRAAKLFRPHSSQRHRAEEVSGH